MPSELAHYIMAHGYLTIFGLVFLQEIGIPNPVPNEIILMYSGYLASIGELSLAGAIATVVAADFIGTTLLYSVFYFFGEWVLSLKWRWLPYSKIEHLKNRLSGKDQWTIYLGRLLPYLRGYTSVAAGLLEIPPKVFLPAVLLSAVTWSGGYVTAGKLLGKRWDTVVNKLGAGQALLLLAGAAIVIFLVIPVVFKHVKKLKK